MLALPHRNQITKVNNARTSQYAMSASGISSPLLPIAASVNLGSRTTFSAPNESASRWPGLVKGLQYFAQHADKQP